MADVNRSETSADPNEKSQKFGDDRDPENLPTPPNPPPGGQNGPPSRGDGDEDL